MRKPFDLTDGKWIFSVQAGKIELNFALTNITHCNNKEI